MNNLRKMLLIITGASVLIAATTVFVFSNISLPPDPNVDNVAPPQPVAVARPAPAPYIPPPRSDDIEEEYAKFGEPMMDAQPYVDTNHPRNAYNPSTHISEIAGARTVITYPKTNNPDQPRGYNPDNPDGG